MGEAPGMPYKSFTSAFPKRITKSSLRWNSKFTAGLVLSKKIRCPVEIVKIELNSVLFRFRGSVCPNRSILLLFTLIFSPAVSPRFTYSFSRLFLLSPLALVQCFMLNLHRLCCFSRLFLFLFLLSLTVYLKEGLYDHCSCTLYFPIKPIVPADD